MGRFARSKRIARIVGINELSNHYRMLLGLDEAWLVKSVDLPMESKRVVIALEHRGGRLTCPECGISCTRADLAPARGRQALEIHTDVLGICHLCTSGMQQREASSSPSSVGLGYRPKNHAANCRARARTS